MHERIDDVADLLEENKRLESRVQSLEEHHKKEIERLRIKIGCLEVDKKNLKYCIESYQEKLKYDECRNRPPRPDQKASTYQWIWSYGPPSFWIPVCICGNGPINEEDLMCIDCLKREREKV